MEQIGKTQIEQLRDEILKTVQTLNIEEKKKRSTELEAQAMAPDFWQDNLKAKSVMSELSQLKEEIDTAKSLEENITTLYEMFSQSS
ncbi:MAG TPA: hypothetical protein VHA74_02090, partial [Candidatus Dojkabacteria bacterium]|nr:hypothetical protein [Candidatus Dojkabacteria bacterium]